MAAWLNGEAAAGTATDAVARLIGKARRPVICVDNIDLSGAVAALDLAKAAGAAIDHIHPTGLAPLQEQGFLGTTFGETKGRADTVVIVGPTPTAAPAAAALGELAAQKQNRAVIRICAHNDPERHGANAVFAPDDLELHEQLGLLRARAAGHPITANSDVLASADALINQLKNSKYVVGVSTPGLIDDLSQFALMSLADTLSADIRFSLLQFGAAPGQAELTRMALALTGLPAPLQFKNQRAIHDPWLYGATNMVARSEADLAVFVSTAGDPPPAALATVKNLVVISPMTASVPNAAQQIETGTPGVDHAGITEDAKTGALTHAEAKQASEKPPLSKILNDITTLIDGQTKETAA